MAARIAIFSTAMAVVLAASNYLVQFPFEPFGLGHYLTWGAFFYPVTFFVNDLANRTCGVAAARRVVLIGFPAALLLSAWFASPRIAVASGTAYLISQLVDAQIFDRLRRSQWWKAPVISTLFGAVVDSLIFFAMAFAAAFAFLDRITGYPDGSLIAPASFLGAEMPVWATLAIGDFFLKSAMGAVALAPYAVMARLIKPTAEAELPPEAERI